MSYASLRGAERRKLPRFPVRSGLFALNNHLGQIIDISMDGLSFRYLERCRQEKNCTCQGIIFDEDDLCFDRIPVQTVDDFIVSHNGTGSTSTIRRCGVRFLDLTPTQKTLLKNFIWFNTAPTR